MILAPDKTGLVTPPQTTLLTVISPIVFQGTLGNQFPFPTPRLKLCASALEDHQDWESGLKPAVDLTVSDYEPSLRRVHLCALPFQLRRRPFVQGFGECAEMALAVCRATKEMQSSPEEPETFAKDLLRTLDRLLMIRADGTARALAGSDARYIAHLTDTEHLVVPT